MLRLTVRNGQFQGVTAEVDQLLTIGRAQEAGLFLPDPQVSRAHAHISREGPFYWIEDAGSHNGTQINEIRIEGRRVLRHADLIKVGNSEILVEYEGTEGGPTTTGPIRIEEEKGTITTTVERSASDLSPPTIDTVTAGDTPIEGFVFTSVDSLRRAPDKSLRLILSNARRFAILFHVSRSLQEINDTDRLLAVMMDHVFKVLKADHGEIVLVHPSTGELVPVISVNRQGVVSDTVRISKTVVTKVLNSRMAIISTDARTDPRLAEAASVVMYGMRSIMCVPMLSQERVLGIVQVVNEKDVAAFGEDDLYLLTVIASLAAVSIENALLIQRQKEALDDARRAHEELVKTQEELIQREKLATVGQLAAGITHEIKNSLGPFALVHLLKERHPDDEVLQEYAGMILESHKRILSIISEVRAFTSGRPVDYEKRPTPLRPMLESVISFLKFDNDIKKVNLRLHVHEDLEANISGDRLKQVVINLIRNAAQALTPTDPRIDIVLTRDGQEAVIRVVDNGCGIPDEEMAQIWLPFHTTKKESGMGLGLAICKTIVEQHGGRIDCSSQVGKGTIMSVRLPAL